jgi:hypothetical protein
MFMARGKETANRIFVVGLTMWKRERVVEIESITKKGRKRTVVEIGSITKEGERGRVVK